MSHTRSLLSAIIAKLTRDVSSVSVNGPPT
jgi:hypothetical protein